MLLLGGPGLGLGPGPADGVYRLQAAQHNIDNKRVNGRTNERSSSQRANHQVSCLCTQGVDVEKTEKPWQMQVSCKLRAEWKAKNGRWSGTRGSRGAVQSGAAAARCQDARQTRKNACRAGWQSTARPAIALRKLWSQPAHFFPIPPLVRQARFCHAGDPLLSRSSIVSIVPIVPIVILKSASSAV